MPLSAPAATKEAVKEYELTTIVPYYRVSKFEQRVRQVRLCSLTYCCLALLRQACLRFHFFLPSTAHHFRASTRTRRSKSHSRHFLRLFRPTPLGSSARSTVAYRRSRKGSRSRQQELLSDAGSRCLHFTRHCCSASGIGSPPPREASQLAQRALLGLSFGGSFSIKHPSLRLHLVRSDRSHRRRFAAAGRRPHYPS